jgi:hypothetical protein
MVPGDGKKGGSIGDFAFNDAILKNDSLRQIHV